LTRTPRSLWVWAVIRVNGTPARAAMVAWPVRRELAVFRVPSRPASTEGAGCPRSG
jgi:hypothetical protein